MSNFGNFGDSYIVHLQTSSVISYYRFPKALQVSVLWTIIRSFLFLIPCFNALYLVLILYSYCILIQHIPYFVFTQTFRNHDRYRLTLETQFTVKFLKIILKLCCIDHFSYVSIIRSSINIIIIIITQYAQRTGSTAKSTHD
jgi:hypothetical protein